MLNRKPLPTQHARLSRRWERMQERREQERMEREAHRVGQHWLEAAVERVRAGEPEEEVLADYGYVPDIPPDYEQG